MQITGMYDYMPFGEQVTVSPSRTKDRLSFIGKENDIESGLGDFGVRKYDGAAGRFLSIDPMWEKYLAWSPYHYCQNNPINATDGNGMWMEGEHNKILDNAFPGSYFVQVLKDASFMADEDQGLAGSYKHAMRAPWQTAQEAEKLYNEFLEQQIQKFATTENYGDALFELGLGMHAKMDAWAPSHNGFQIWNGLGADANHPDNIIGQAVNGIKGLAHAAGEWGVVFLTDNKCEKVAEDISKYYDRALEAREKYQKEKGIKTK